MIKDLSNEYLDRLEFDNDIPRNFESSFFQVKLIRNSLKNIDQIETLKRGRVYFDSLNDYLAKTLQPKYIYQKIILIPLALVGMNGDNETNINFSNQIEIIVSDENKNDLMIKNLSKPIELVIENDMNLTRSEYKYMNLSNFTNQELLLKFFINKNVSVHVQIKPLYQSFGYIAKLKYGIYISNDNFDLWKLFCKNGNLNFVFMLHELTFLI